MVKNLKIINNRELVDIIIGKLLKISNFYRRDKVHQSELSFVYYFKLNTAITMKEKIYFVLPAFPAKSRNRNKTYSSLPDYGEVASLKMLNGFAAEVSELYKPGVEIIICSDGRVFSDLVGVTEDDVTLYKKAMKDIVKTFKFSHISFFGLEDSYSSKMSFSQMRYILERDYARDLFSIKQSVKNEKRMLLMFNGIHRFIKEDYLFIKKSLSKNQINKLSKEVAYKVIQRSNAWSSLVESFFPQAVRLSIHPQEVLSDKFPIKLLPCKENWGTPWHRVAVKSGNNIKLMKTLEIKKMGGILKKYLNKYVYFELGISV